MEGSILKITVGTFAASLNAQIDKHGGNEIESIEQMNEGYAINTKNHVGEKIKLQINSETAKTAVCDAVGAEIAVYSIMENIAYITLIAGQMINDKKITDAPKPELVTFIIQIAEEFDHKNGIEMVGNDTVEAINKFAKKKLADKFG
jgi:hypothetical protein